MAIRTDLAMEAKALWEQSAGKTTRLQGVTARERMTDGFAVTSVEILNRQGEQALGKPAGTYVSVELPRQEHDPRRPAQAVAQELRQLMALGPKDSVLVVGLGNEAVTPDALGPKTAAGLFLTRHLIEHLPEYFGDCRSVSAVTPGVLATTGIESIEVVRGACAHVRPDCVLCIDALAAGAPERLCNTIQMTDTGIVPGSGVGNRRASFQKETLGVPVFSIGVPTVVDAASLNAESGRTPETLIVTPRDIDAQVHFLSAVLSDAINLALHPGFTHEDFAQFVSFPQS